MNKQERFERGAKLIDDARFVYEVFIPSAVNAEQWNIVVFECYRASELLVKGIINSMGYEHKQSHKLHKLVHRLQQILQKEKNQVPFIYRAVQPSGNYYETRIRSGYLILLRCVNGVYTQLGATISLPNPYIPPRLYIEGSSVSVKQGSNKLLSTCDYAMTDNVSYKKKILRPPDETRLNCLNEMVELLLSTREEAFYIERFFKREESVEYAQILTRVFELSKAFEFTERISAE